MKTYVFPGQGSQVKGMGKDLFNDFTELIKKADDVLGYSIKELCLDNPDKKLHQTQYTQPAMYVVNALSYLKKVDAEGEPDFLAGHSLGEYNALLAAGAFSFEDGLKMVKKRGELMSKAKKGAMAAILNSSESQINEILENANLATIDIANLNAPTQIVISGLQEEVTRAQTAFEEADTMFIPLNTSGAFHSRYMKDAGDEFATFAKDFKFSDLKIPVIANVSGKPYESDNVAQNLINQLTSCVRWSDSVMYIMDQGEMEFAEMGVGDVLTKLIDYVQRAWKKQAKTAKKEAPAEKKAAPKPQAPPAPAKKESETTDQPVDTSKWKDGSVEAEEMVKLWNTSYPVGTKVSSILFEAELETRTEAMVLFGHRAVVYMKDYNGYFDLRELSPVK